MAVTLRRVGATEFRTYQPIMYEGGDPLMPLYEVQIFKRGHFNAGIYAVDPADNPWMHAGTYHCQLVNNTDTSDHRVAYGYTTAGAAAGSGQWALYTAAGVLDTVNRTEWAAGVANAGTNDARIAGMDSTTIVRTDSSTGALGTYATIALTVPAGWGLAILEISYATLNTYNVSGDVKFELTDADGVPVPLNGRGITRIDVNDTTVVRGVPVTDPNGVINVAAAATTSGNHDLELARGLAPGNYTLKATKQTATASNRMAVGRVVLRRMEGNLIPGATGVAEYLPEYSLDASALVVPGPYCFYWQSSHVIMVKVGSSIDDFAGGSEHGRIGRVSETITADGVDVSGMANGTYSGPHDSVVFALVTDYHRQLASGSTGDITNGVADVDVGAADLTNVEDDFTYAYFYDRADGENSTARFTVIGHDSTVVDHHTLTVDPTPTSGSDATAWYAISDTPFARITETYTVRGGKMNIALDVDWMFAGSTAVTLFYVASMRPQSPGGASGSPAASTAYRPRHSTAVSGSTDGVYPFDATHFGYWQTERTGAAPFEFPLSPAAVSTAPAAVQRVSAQVSNFLANRRYFRFMNIPAREHREVGRNWVCDFAWANAVGGNLTTNALKMFILQGSQPKTYVAIANGVTVTAGATNWTCSWDLYWTEEAYWQRQSRPPTNQRIEVGL